ncbi:MAG: SidA/IucD/PvdA family monooxygenase [Acetobacter sp.]|nr:SidA/IucD/PvdA family monooxygenase [Acetobacter sp.]
MNAEVQISRQPVSTTVAIIGGGATGTMIAYHLLRKRRDLGSNNVVIFEPRPRLGAGVAYGSKDPQHRINVPASRMSIDTENPNDFTDWLKQHSHQICDPEAFLPSGDIYPTRAEFGRYLFERITPFLVNQALLHVQDTVVSLQRDGDYWQIQTAQGTVYTAAYAVIATSHPAPALPAPLQKIAHDPRVISDPWAKDIFKTIAPQARIAIIGTGLTMADVVATLAAQGHLGSITAISRRGLRSRGHSHQPASLFGDFSTNPEQTALGLLRRIRKTLTSAPDRPWQDIFDALRRQGKAIWMALPATEQRRLVRHLRPFWDVHRFRIAPQVERALNLKSENGSLTVLAARIEHVEVAPDGLILHLRERGGRNRTIQTDILINTTGPDHAGILTKPGFLSHLAQNGFVQRDPVGLGLWTGEDHAALVGEGPVSGLFVAGPLSRGTFGELMGFPEVTANAQSVAARLADVLQISTHSEQVHS